MKTVTIAMMMAGALAVLGLSACEDKAPEAKPAAAPAAPAAATASATPAPAAAPAKAGGGW